jgi:hypothetical protein
MENPSAVPLVIANSRDCPDEAGPETGGSISISQGNFSSHDPFRLNRAHLVARG